MKIALAWLALLASACDSGGAPTAVPPPATTIDCFGTPCSSTCCLVGDAGICTDDAAACESCVPIDLRDAGDAGDACVPSGNFFQCFSSADCPPEPPSSNWLDGPVACCASGFFGVSTGCARLGFFGCGLLSSIVCTRDSDCEGRGTCRALVVNGVVAVHVCQ